MPSTGPSFGQNQDEKNPGQTDIISEEELMTFGKSIVDGSGDPFAIIHTICSRFGIAPKSISIDTRTQSNPSLFIHLISALFTFLPNSHNFHLLPLFTTILQRHPPSLPHFLSSPLWLSLPSILASPPQHHQSPPTLQTQPQPSPQTHNGRNIEEQPHLRPVLTFVNSILQMCLSSSPPTPVPNKTLLSSTLSTLSSHPDPLVKANSGFSLLLLNQLDGDVDDSLMPVNELVAQRDALRIKIAEQDEEIRELMKIQEEKDETIAELTKKLGEFVAMEKRLSDKLNTMHSKVVAVEAQVTESAKDVKWIRGIIRPEHLITVWDPTHFRKEGRRITSLVPEYKSCFSDEIRRGVWRVSVRCNNYDATRFGVVESSKLEQSKTTDLVNQSGASVFWLNNRSVNQNGTQIATGNQEPNNNSVVTMELDMNRHTLVLFVDGHRQPYSLTNIPQNVRFALFIYGKDRYADILSFDECPQHYLPSAYSFRPIFLPIANIAGHVSEDDFGSKSLGADLQIGLGADLKVYTQIRHS
ncbi:hypothetical protein BLNAU_23724 [Blattamonas nauphoetae]|uniref:TLDc domain-containing protein n=1 Tax=Blattamonas nauphoetae TaxID=2049346 RepID=A0ABQ9WRH9_9EUKA|nr:hypothetical protein BLNAU_23724 [Blattamonas nauphoetae]